MMQMLALILAGALGPSAPASDPIVSSFAFFGCNRIDKKDWEATRASNPSSANVPQLRQTLRDVAAVKPTPKILFAGGDLVMNYVDDQGQVLREQLDDWTKIVQSEKLPAGLQIVPIAGNHELNRKVGDDKLPNVAADAVWNDWLARNHYFPTHPNGPRLDSPNSDRVATDQSRLTYSFDLGSVHFVVVNTDTRTAEIDPVTRETKIAWVPVQWIKRDLDAAQRDPKIKSIFLLGHRNLVDPLTSKGDAPVDPAVAKPLVDAILAHSKVRAYICAHVHAYDVSPLRADSSVMQVVSGHGGSVLEKSWSPVGGPTFGFAVFNVHASGAIGLVGYHRPLPVAPQKYFEEGPVRPAPAKPTPEVLLWSPSAGRR